MEIKHRGRIYRAGDKVKASINNCTPFTAMLYYNGYSWFLLHNIPEHNGNRADDMHNYPHSWRFNDIGGFLTDGVTIRGGAENCKESFEVQTQFDDFLRERINTEYLEKINVVKNAIQIYSLYRTDDNSKYGFVKFMNEKGNMTEMKFGRFLTCYINDVKKHYDIDLSLDAKTIEKFHNEYISHQKENNIQIEFLKGEDILQGYMRDNYHENNGRLSGSCMTDKTHFLKLYTQNDCVELLAVKMDGKFIGRAFVWQTEKGKYLDSVYTTNDWVYSIFNYVKREKGYLVASQEEEVRIPVNTEGIENYPYLDTFMYLTPDGKTLYNHNNSKPDHNAHENETRILRHTGGSYELIRNNNNNENENNEPF